MDNLHIRMSILSIEINEQNWRLHFLTVIYAYLNHYNDVVGQINNGMLVLQIFHWNQLVTCSIFIILELIQHDISQLTNEFQ